MVSAAIKKCPYKFYMTKLEQKIIMTFTGCGNVYADGGDSTVGVALEPLAEGVGKIKVLISRRNKSLAVEEVEALVVERVAGMKIEDEVQRLITTAVTNLNLDPRITKIAQDEAGKLDAALTVRLDNVSGQIGYLRDQFVNFQTSFSDQIAVLNSRIDGMASSTALMENIKIDENGDIVIGKSPLTPLVKGGNAWTNVSQGEAQLACQTLGTGYHLLGENEWLAIAENVLQVRENDLTPHTPLSKGGAGELKLSNGNAINNLSGDIAQWTNQNVTAAGLPIAPSDSGWFEYGEVSDFKGMNIAPDYYLSDANNKIGKIFIGSGSGLRGFVRGSGGIYGLDLSRSPAEKSDSVGFRCAK